MTPSKLPILAGTILKKKDDVMEAFMNSSFGTFITFLFAQHFSTRSWQSFVLLSYGWALSRWRHTIANYIWLSGATQYKHFSRFYDFLSGAFLKALPLLWQSLLLLMDQMITAQMVIELWVDDTVRKKSGRKIQGASYYQNRAGSARQEYRSLWGLNFVYIVACFTWIKGGKTFKLALPLGLRIYLKEEVATQLERPFCSRSELARQMIDFVAFFLPHRQFLIKADGGYATKKFLRNLPHNTQVNARFLITARLYDLPPKTQKKKVGRPPTKGKDLGTPKEWILKEQGWRPHPEEAGALIKIVTGIWHSVLPGIVIRVVAVWRKDGPPQDKRSGKKELEAFFSTELSFSARQILEHYSLRWGVEIDIRDAYAYYGLGKDHCRKLDRIFGANSFRLLMASCRTLWFIRYFQNRNLLLKKFRPWYRQKEYPAQLDVISAAQEAFALQGIYPAPRFIIGINEIEWASEDLFDNVA